MTWTTSTMWAGENEKILILQIQWTFGEEKKIVKIHDRGKINWRKSEDWRLKTSRSEAIFCDIFRFSCLFLNSSWTYFSVSKNLEARKWRKCWKRPKENLWKQNQPSTITWHFTTHINSAAMRKYEKKSSNKVDGSLDLS